MFGSNSKGICLDLVGDFAVAARVSSMAAPFTVEEVREFDLADPGSADALRKFAGGRGTGFTSARCGVYPPNRVMARVAVDGRKLREEGYLVSHVADVLKIDAAAYQLVSLSPADGSDVSALRSPPKEILVCGAPTEELAGIQMRLLELGLFPERLEIGSVSSVGGVINYLGYSNTSGPVLLLEISSEVTQASVLSRDGIEISRTVPFGINSMIPLVQKELALKDEESARKLFFSNNFDFTGMGPQLTKRLLRELQASIGFYEVQTGQSISQLACTLLPTKVAWLQRTLADVLGMKVLGFDHAPWMATMGITLADSVATAELGTMWTNLFCLMGEYQAHANEAAA